MKSACLVIFALSAAAIVAAQHPRSPAQPAEKREIRLVLVLRARDPYRPGDVNLSIRLVNVGSRKLMMPNPRAMCESADGYIKINRKLLSAAKYPERGSVCVADFFGQRDLPDEAHKYWLTMAPGAAYDVSAELMFDNPGARYELRAKYVPAQFTSEELRVIREHGINVVQESPESEPLVIKAPK